MQKLIYQFIGSLGDGGAETLIRNYVLNWNEMSHVNRIIVLWPQPNTNNVEVLKSKGFSLTPVFKRRSIIHRLGCKFLKERYVSFFLKRMICKEHPDIIHVHLANLKYLKPISRFLHDSKLYYTCHSVPSMFFSGANVAEYESAKYLIRYNNLQMIALHNDMATEINRLFGISNTIVIRNGIDINRFRSIKKSAEEIRKELGIPQESTVIGHVGRFAKVKNHEFLLKVFFDCLNKQGNVFLLLIGDGELQPLILEQLKKADAKGKYCILSHRNDIPELMYVMDVFVFPSFHEGLSLTLLEAQASGIPCYISSTISKANMVSSNIHMLDLDDSVHTWSDCVLEKQEKHYSSEMDEYDIHNVVEVLKGVYFQ